MRLSVWLKLALTMITIMAVTITAGVLLANRSFEKGFLVYLNTVQGERLEDLKSNLIADYAANGSWDYLKTDTNQWLEYLQTNAVTYKSPTQRLKQNSPTRSEQNNSAVDRLSADKKSQSKQTPRTSDRKRGSRIERRSREYNLLVRSLNLLDENENLVAGVAQNTSRSALLTPLSLNNKTIGYFQFQPFAAATESIDRSFATAQKKSWIVIGFLSILFTAIASWIASRFLGRPIALLTKSAKLMANGDYQQRIPVHRNDEIGELAQSFNSLASTLEKNKNARQHWIADISHELRTPLAVLKGEIEAIEDGVRELTPQAIASLGAEVTQLNKLVSDLYELSLSDLGALNYQMQSVDPTTVLLGTLTTFAQKLKNANISSHIDCTCNSPLVNADEARLMQLFSNLFENSVRYTDSGGSLKVSCAETTDNWEVIIKDSSPGVVPEQIPHLFERLYRTEKSRGRKTGGAGLGLAIVSEIVNAHNGTISAATSDLGGLEIRLTLPLVTKR